jgi:gamma-glutamyl-gamma-aminobutyrate hydrolase PuuD
MSTIRIGVTQRVEVLPSRGERRDSLDQRWTLLLNATGMVCLPLPNFPLGGSRLLDTLAIDGLLLSGGNNVGLNAYMLDVAPERDEFEKTALDWMLQRGRPVLGICRGMQMMNYYLGGHLSPVSGHAGCRHVVKPAKADAAWTALRDVNSFHEFGIAAADLAADLEPLAFAPDGLVEAARHRALPWYGLMWHPERESPFDNADLDLVRRVMKGE